MNFIREISPDTAVRGLPSSKEVKEGGIVFFRIFYIIYNRYKLFLLELELVVRELCQKYDYRQLKLSLWILMKRLPRFLFTFHFVLVGIYIRDN